MKVACHYAIPRPPQPKLDAAVQDGIKLIESLGGEINFLYPGSKAKKIIPRFLCGLHQLHYLRQLDHRVDLHQIFSNGIYPYPVLRLFTKPIVFTSVIELQSKFPPFSRSLLKQVRKFVVVTDKDQDKLTKAGLASEVILPGIDIDRFSYNPLQIQDNFVLLFGSAPWNEAQFEEKGVNALLQAAREIPWLHLIFLWRGKLLQEMKARVHSYGLSDRVQVLDRRVDVNKIQSMVHASIVLATKSELVKAYPHSLLESLAAGKPVVISACLPMADYVDNKKCGVIVAEVKSADLIDKICFLRTQYEFFVSQVNELNLGKFSGEAMVSSYLRLYQRILG